MWLVSIAGGVLKPLSRFAASFGRKNAPYVIAKKRSDCGNLNLSVGRAAYFLRSQFDSAEGNLRRGIR